jgi:two-component system response regulator TtrR
MRDNAVVYLLDDDDGVREFLASVLTGAGIDVEMFSSPSEFLAVFDSERPSCLVFDVQLPEISGLALWKELRKKERAHACILVTGHGTIAMAVDAMRNGAFDLLEKPVDYKQLIACVRQALDHDLLARRSSRDASETAERIRGLTSRQLEIMEMVVDGQLTKQIAKALGISTKTVEVHRSNITKRMGVESVAQLVKLVTGHTVHSDSVLRAEGKFAQDALATAIA